MCENMNLDAIASSNGVQYCVITGDENSCRPYGVFSVLENDRTDAASVENFFFTKNEAIECCKWLAENEVYPITLKEVISDLYFL